MKLLYCNHIRRRKRSKNLQYRAKIQLYHSSISDESADIPGTVFTGDTDLLGSLRHLGCCCCDERFG
jgi:hypothetical protein